MYFCCVFPFPEKGTLDFIAHGSIIRVFTVSHGRCETVKLALSTLSLFSEQY